MKSYLVIGKERLLKKEFIRDLQKKHFPDASALSLNFQEFSAEEDTLPSFLDFISTSPFLSSLRLAVLWDIDELEKDDQGKLIAALDAVPATGLAVLVSEQTSLKKSAFLQSLEKKCEICACHAPFDKDLPGWVDQRARKMGNTIDRGDAVRLLIERVGKDVASLQNALETLAVYVHPRKEILAADVLALLGKTAGEDIFLLVDELIQAQKQAAMIRLQGLFREGARVPEIIGVLASQMERIKSAAELSRQGMTPVQIATFLRVHPYFQDKFFAQLKRVSVEGMVRWQKKLLECDALVKRGRLEERLALERLILES